MKVKKNKILYENVRIEMARQDMTILDISERIGMNSRTLSRKLSGTSPLNLDEAFDIQKKCFPDTEIKVLFKECNTA